MRRKGNATPHIAYGQYINFVTVCTAATLVVSITATVYDHLFITAAVVAADNTLATSSTSIASSAVDDDMDVTTTCFHYYYE